MKKKSLNILDDILENLNVFLEGFSTIAGDGVTCIGFATDKLFIYKDITCFFQRIDMAGKVAVGYIQQLFQARKVQGIIHIKRRHDSQTNLAFKDFVKTSCYIFHFSRV